MIFVADKIVPIVTPFDDDKLSSEKLKHHAAALLEEGMDCIFLCGSTGLGPALTYEERVTTLESLRDISENVIFQVGTLDLSESLRLAELAKKYKVKAISAYPPYYFPRIPTDWLVKYFVKISKVYPLLLYNFPLTTGYDITSDVAKKIINSGGDIIGVKDTVNDISHMLSFKWEIGENFLVYSGPDSMILPALRSKLDGVIAGSANYATELVVRLFEDIQSENAFAIQRLITELTIVARKYGQWSANYAMSKMLRNYDVGEPRPPIFPLSGEDIEKMKEDVRNCLSHTRRETSDLLKHFAIR